jgi:hypothetical protein
MVSMRGDMRGLSLKQGMPFRVDVLIALPESQKRVFKEVTLRVDILSPSSERQTVVKERGELPLNASFVAVRGGTIEVTIESVTVSDPVKFKGAALPPVQLSTTVAV